MFFLFNILIGVVFVLLALVIVLTLRTENAIMAALFPLAGVYMLYSLAAMIPGLAVSIRRLHDTDRSGWSLLLGLIPLVGPIILLVFYASPGTPGPNRFGYDPNQQYWGYPTPA